MGCAGKFEVGYRPLLGLPFGKGRRGFNSSGSSAVVSHISRTTSEMWGTLLLVAGIEFKSFDGASPDRSRPTYAGANVGHPSLYQSFIWPPKVRAVLGPAISATVTVSFL
jgi:hypothetical protein